MRDVMQHTPVTQSLPPVIECGDARRSTRTASHRRGPWLLAALAGFLVIVCAGCSPGNVVKEVRIPVRERVGAIERCRQYLEGYARGEPVGSEVIGFTQLIDEATQEDAEVGAALGRGLREIEATLKQPQNVTAKAKAILESLPASPAAPAG
jgi:hypothetical protein